VAGLGLYPISSLLEASTRIPPQPRHTETPTHIQTKTHDQCGDTREKSQAPDVGCINVRNMLSIEEAKLNLITCDIKLVSYSSTTTIMHGAIYISRSVIYIIHSNFEGTIIIFKKHYVY